MAPLKQDEEQLHFIWRIPVIRVFAFIFEVCGWLLFRIILLAAALLAWIYFSALAAQIGAMAGGVKSGGWNFQFMPSLVFGAYGGAVLGCLTAVVKAC